jgi:hypothetical protein
MNLALDSAGQPISALVIDSLQIIRLDTSKGIIKAVCFVQMTDTIEKFTKIDTATIFFDRNMNIIQ